MRDLTPYDTGERAEPSIWRIDRNDRDSYGKVDFEDDASEPVLTVWLERDGNGYTLKGYGHVLDKLAIEIDQTESLEITDGGIQVQLWRAEHDGVRVVQIDTEPDDEEGRLRINLNDAPLWDGNPQTDERPGAHFHDVWADDPKDDTPTETFGDISDERQWEWDREIELCRDFIDAHGLGAQLVAYARQEADKEAAEEAAEQEQ